MRFLRALLVCQLFVLTSCDDTPLPITPDIDTGVRQDGQITYNEQGTDGQRDRGPREAGPDTLRDGPRGDGRQGDGPRGDGPRTDTDRMDLRGPDARRLDQGCVAKCAGKACGAPDGCGGRCGEGTCASGKRCVNNTCTCDAYACPAGCCKDNECKPGTTDALCGRGTQCIDCTANSLTCGASQSCAGCVPQCSGKRCGDPDGCGGACNGACDSGQICSNGLCVCNAQSCGTGCCQGVTCRQGTSDSLCGGGGLQCENCLLDGLQCEDKSCKACVPDCSNKTCGANDGCGGQCGSGSCPTGLSCEDNTCVCGTHTGCNGCCSGNTCHPGTEEANCGTSGLTCQGCSGTDICNNGACTPCTPTCNATTACGADDGCGGTCKAGHCGSGQACDNGTCVPTVCLQKVADGTHKNPGCDPEVQQSGFTSIAAVRENTGRATWFFTKDKKYWIVVASDILAPGGHTLSAAGKDIALYWEQTAKPSPCAIPNPGCDSGVRARGLDSAAWSLVASPDTGSGAFMTLGSTYWSLNASSAFPSGPQFTSSGSVISAIENTYPTSCTTLYEGYPLNPKCRIGAGGFTALGTLLDYPWGPSEPRSYWFATQGRKFWVLDYNTRDDRQEFVAAGSDVADFFRDKMGGTGSRNPGNDSGVKSSGPDTIALISVSNTNWKGLVTKGIKWWMVEDGTWYRYGTDIAALLRGL